MTDKSKVELFDDKKTEYVIIGGKTFPVVKDDKGEKYTDYGDTELPLYDPPPLCRSKNGKPFVAILECDGGISKVFIGGEEVSFVHLDCLCCHNKGYEDKDGYTHCAKCGGHKTDYLHDNDRDCLEWIRTGKPRWI